MYTPKPPSSKLQVGQSLNSRRLVRNVEEKSEIKKPVVKKEIERVSVFDRLSSRKEVSVDASSMYVVPRGVDLSRNLRPTGVVDTSSSKSRPRTSYDSNGRIVRRKTVVDRSHKEEVVENKAVRVSTPLQQNPLHANSSTVSTINNNSNSNNNNNNNTPSTPSTQVVQPRLAHKPENRPPSAAVYANTSKTTNYTNLQQRCNQLVRPNTPLSLPIITKSIPPDPATLNKQQDIHDRIHGLNKYDCYKEGNCHAEEEHNSANKMYSCEEYTHTYKCGGYSVRFERDRQLYQGQRDQILQNNVEKEENKQNFYTWLSRRKQACEMILSEIDHTDKLVKEVLLQHPHSTHIQNLAQRQQAKLKREKLNQEQEVKLQKLDEMLLYNYTNHENSTNIDSTNITNSNINNANSNNRNNTNTNNDYSSILQTVILEDKQRRLLALLVPRLIVTMPLPDIVQRMITSVIPEHAIDHSTHAMLLHPPSVPLFIKGILHSPQGLVIPVAEITPYGLNLLHPRTHYIIQCLQMVIQRAMVQKQEIGLTQEQIDTLPCFTSLQTNDCAVCLDTMVKKVCVELQCTHMFHVDCASSWLKRSNTCPLCRKEAIT